jgi:CRP-like cAMP-binding protein
VETSRLASIPLFSHLDEADLTSAAGAAAEVEAAEGQEIVTEGDFGYALYAIESGTAVVTTDGAQVATLGPGDVFGEMALLASGRRTATVTSTSPMRLIALFKRDVWALERQRPETAARLRELIADRLPTLLAERRAPGSPAAE